MIEYPGKRFDDPDYDHLLDQFARDHPTELELWRGIEKGLFQSRSGPGKYPDQDLMKLCIGYLQQRLVDECGGLGGSHAWKVLRGRILRELLDAEPQLNPAPGKPLMTEPRTCSDGELISLAEAFSRERPEAWREWERIEAEGQFDDDPLRVIFSSFLHYLQTRCWVQAGTAAASVFVDVRGLFFRSARRASSALGVPE